MSRRSGAKGRRDRSDTVFQLPDWGWSKARLRGRTADQGEPGGWAVGSSDPETRLRQLAQLRAAYEACAGRPGHRTGSSAARHSKALLGRILAVLSGVRDGGAGAPATGSDKARTRT